MNRPARALLALAGALTVWASLGMGPVWAGPSGSSSGYGAAVLPCAQPQCDQQPSGIEITYPVAFPPQAIEVTWTTAGRPSAAPSPATSSAVLYLVHADPRISGCSSPSDSEAAACWAWPAALEDSGWVLNGDYSVVACSVYGTNGCSAASPAMTASSAVAPGPPAAVKAVGGSSAQVSWHPPSAEPPDLAGYVVERDGAIVYSCALPAANGTGHPACPKTLTYTDHPSAGRHLYSVAAERLGAGADASDVLSSLAAASGGAVDVVVTAARSGGPVPVVGGSAGVLPSSSSATVPVSPTTSGRSIAGSSLLLGAAPAPGASADGGAISGSSSTSSKATPADASASGPAAPVDPRGSGGTRDVAPLGMVALAVLILALAAHVLYLRFRLGLLQSRHAQRSVRPW